jgi:hypothetical protein
LFSNSLSLCSSQTQSSTPVQNYRQNYSSVYFNHYIFRQQVWRQGSELNCRKHSWIGSAINFLIKFWFLTDIPKYFNSATFSKNY